MNNFSIREANSEEAEFLAELIRDAFRDVADRFGLTPEITPTHPSNCTADWIVTAFEKGIRYFILEQDDRTCGCAAIEQANKDACYLERLAVPPAFRNRGFGTALTRHVMAEAQTLGAKQLEIAIIAGQTELKNWYIKLGFMEIRTARFDHLPFEVLFLKYNL